MATIEGSRTTTPIPFTYTRVLAVPRSIPKSLLKDAALNQLLSYIQVLKLDDQLKLPMGHLREVQKNRNAAIHVGAALRRGDSFDDDSLHDFNQIIRFFGI